ncbi:MAG: hypothetical protein KF819_33300 [Labilithrix sp.]|nr:hypothetical protein [Labilithrix sp.]
MVARLAASAVAALSLLVACSPFKDGADPSSPDAADVDGAADAGVPDAEPDGSGPEADPLVPPVTTPRARACEPGKVFQQIEPVTFEGNLNVESARFTTDRSHGYLAAYPPGGSSLDTEIYGVLRQPPSVTHYAAKLFNALAAPGVFDSHPAVSRDGLRMVFMSKRTGVLALLPAVRAPTGNFVVGAPLERPPTANLMGEPYLLDTDVLYFAAAAGGSEWNLYRASGGPPKYGTDAALPLAINDSVAADNAPVVTADELEIFFASNRADANAKGGLDIWSASRLPAAPVNQFAGASLIELVSTPGIDFPVWVSHDACDLYFVRKASPTEGGRLFIAHR